MPASRIGSSVTNSVRHWTSNVRSRRSRSRPASSWQRSRRPRRPAQGRRNSGRAARRDAGCESSGATRSRPRGEPLALPEQGPGEPAGRLQPANLTLSELDRAGEGRRRTDVHQPGGCRQPDVRRLRERESQGAQLPAAGRAAQVTDRLADSGEGRVHAAGRAAPRLPHERRHQVDEADVAVARRYPGPARAAPPRGPLGVMDHVQHRHLATTWSPGRIGRTRFSHAAGPCCSSDRPPPTAHRMELSPPPREWRLSSVSACVTHCHAFGYSIQSTRLLITADRVSAESP